jgi:hypothetical protein
MAKAGDGGRARRALNLATIEGMAKAFQAGGQAAINKVMKQSPAIFLKMLVLLVPREMEISHSNVIKNMTDEQIEAAIEAIQTMLARQATHSASNSAVMTGLGPKPAVNQCARIGSASGDAWRHGGRNCVAKKRRTRHDRSANLARLRRHSGHFVTF